ncbi:MAG: S-layer homology domain-containing protein, partial [Bacillota bacterium]|nr:S-layer homology domain-containing protein [Bacillota bacterium]
GEFAKMLVAASKYKNEVSGQAVSALYPDVPKTHWAADYVRVAVEKGWMTGSASGRFRVNDGIRAEEAATSLLKLLGYDPAALAGAFPQAQLTKAKSLGLADGLSLERGKVLTERDCVLLFYNLLNAKTADGKVYATELGYSVSGKTINYSSVVSEELQGPFVLHADGEIPVSFPVNIVYRNGVSASLDEAKEFDVYYYNEGMQTVWLYSNHVTGTYSVASPNTVAPETATVAGATYRLEAAAAYKLSSLGEYKIGDIVTLLIGMDGTAVDVVGTEKFSGSYIGVVTGTGVNDYVNALNVTKAEKVIYVTCTDGTNRTFRVDDSYSKGDMVSVSFADGKHKVTRLQKREIHGSVSKDATTLGGSHSLAADVRILNISQDGTVKRIYSSKLAGKRLESSDVYYYVKNADNKVTDLILYNVFSEGREYGIVFDVKESTVRIDGEREVEYSYKYIINGTTFEATTLEAVSSGPAVFRVGDKGREYFTSMTSRSLSSVDALTAHSGSMKFDVCEYVQCYINADTKSYNKSNINSMDASQYTLMGYVYDNAVRIIIATPK